MGNREDLSDDVGIDPSKGSWSSFSFLYINYHHVIEKKFVAGTM